MFVQTIPGSTFTKVVNRTLSFNVVVQYVAVNPIGNVSLAITIANDNLTDSGFITEVRLAASDSPPTGLPTAATVGLTVQLGSWAAISNTYQLQAHLLPHGSNWADRESSNVAGFALVAPAEAPTPAPVCHDIAAERSPWHNGVAPSFGCAFFSGPSNLCGADAGAPGLASLTSSQACCACGGGLANGNEVRIESAPSLIRLEAGTGVSFNVTVLYGTAFADVTNTYRIVVVVRNDEDPTHLGYISSVRLTDGSLPDELPPASRLTLTVNLGGWVPAVAGYRLYAVLLPSAGSWSSRLARSPSTYFNITNDSSSETPVVQLQVVPQSIIRLAGGTSVLPLQVRYDAGIGATGLYRLVTVVGNNAFTHGGYIRGTTQTGTAIPPSGLPSSGVVSIDVTLGSWAPTDTGYEVYVALLPNDGPWSTRLTTSATSTFAVRDAAGAVYDVAADGAPGVSEHDDSSNPPKWNEALVIGLVVAATASILVLTVVARVARRRLSKSPVIAVSGGGPTLWEPTHETAV